jgi:hypothetical protein
MSGKIRTATTGSNSRTFPAASPPAARWTKRAPWRPRRWPDISRYYETKGHPVPSPSSIEALKHDPDQAGTLLVLVDLPANFLKAERVNVMIPRHLLGRIDAASGGNRSRFLVEAAEQKLAG